MKHARFFLKILSLVTFVAISACGGDGSNQNVMKVQSIGLEGVSGSTLTIKEGERRLLTATVVATNATDDLLQKIIFTWSAIGGVTLEPFSSTTKSDEAIRTVTGKSVHAKATGDGGITISAEGVNASFQVTFQPLQ